MKNATRYDEVAYPTAIFPQTHPERLSVIARLHGLDPPDLATARVLEIGGGDSMSLLAVASAYPQAQLHGFDLSATAIERGRAMQAAAGITNVTLDVLDIMDARARFAAASFDYVIAHGVYAWVPEPVRRETMALVGHVLSDHGVAFVSFNALPGGHVRMILRDMLLHVLEGVDETADRIAAMRQFLADFAVAHDADDPVMTAVRVQAASMLERPDGVLFHDELGPEFAPQLLSRVAAAAEAVGLTFLSDAGRNRHLDGFLPEDAPPAGDADAAVLRAAQLDDFLSMRFFRQPLFVRRGRRPRRDIAAGLPRGLYLSTTLARQPDGEFESGKDRIVIPDATLADALEAASAIAPRRVAVDAIATTPDQRRVVLQLFAEWYVRLHRDDAPFPTTPGDRPCTSRLVRAQLLMGDRHVCSLDHRLLTVDQPELRALLIAADGTRSTAEIAAIVVENFPADQIDAALAAAARRGLLSA